MTFPRSIIPSLLFAVVIAAAAGNALPVQAAPPIRTDADVVRRVSFNPVLGETVPRALRFSSVKGPIELGELLGKRPSILTFAWMKCTNLCGLILNGLADSSGDLNQRLSVQGLDDYQVVVVGMDPDTTTAQLRHKKNDLSQQYPGADIAGHWHFLAGTFENIHALADAVGFQFVYDPRKEQFAHPAGVVALDRDGRIADFMTGMNYRTEDLARLLYSTTLAEPAATQGNPILLLCYDYDPTSGRYTLAIMKVLRLFAVVCLLLLGGALWFWQRRYNATQAREHGWKE